MVLAPPPNFKPVADPMNGTSKSKFSSYSCFILISKLALFTLVADNVGFSVEFCEVASYPTLVAELQKKRAAFTISGFYMTAQWLPNVTYIDPAIVTYSMSLMMSVLY